MSPYIPKKRRDEIKEFNFVPRTPGELNWHITDTILQYLTTKIGNTPHKIEHNYTDYNEVIGVLECCKLELYRRVVALYEDKKKEENGDVF